MRKSRYLVAGASALIAPFSLGAIAVGLGMSDDGGIASSLLRLLVFPHFLPAICLGFLYIDEEKYGSFRNLGIVFEIASLVLLAAMLLPVYRDPESFAAGNPDTAGLVGATIGFIAAVLVDTLGLLILFSHPDSRDTHIAAAEKEP